MPYQGRQPGVGVRNRFIFTATSGQTSFSGADDNGSTLKYDDGAYVDAYLNGVLLIPSTDYAATTKTSVVLTSGAATSDILEVVAYGISSIADTVRASTGGTFAGAVTVDGNFTVDNGTIKLDGNYPTGTGNVALGDAALDDGSLSGNYNTAVGSGALTSNTSGSSNFAFGANTLYSNTTGSNNAAISGLYSNTTGSFNTGLGMQALNSNTTASNNTAVGYQAAYSNTTGQYNTVVGQFALFNNTTANYNTAVGQGSGRYNTTGAENVMVGVAALEDNTTGNYNAAFGSEALTNNTTGSYNTAVGRQSLYSNTTGTQNTVVGLSSGRSTTSNNNTFIGMESGYYVTTGANNTILGRYNGNQGGLDIRTQSNNIVLSDGNGNPRLFYRDTYTKWYSGNNTADYYWPNVTSSAGYDASSLSVSNGVIAATSSNGGAVVYLDRNTSDGKMIGFYGTGTEEGNISVSGTSVSYNGGHLSRWSQLADNSKDTSLLKGTVMTNLDQMAVWSHDAVAVGDEIKNAEGQTIVATEADVHDAYTEDNDQLNCMAISSVEGDPNVAGVFVNWDEVDDGFNDMNIAMTGDMIIRIAQGTTVQRGDLLMSAGDGTAKPQGDDIVRSKTIAKVTSTHVTCTYDDGSYCVPCVLMAC